TCSRPASRQRSRIHSASARSRREPATCGSDVRNACASRALSAEGSPRKRRSVARSADDERAVKPKIGGGDDDADKKYPTQRTQRTRRKSRWSVWSVLTASVRARSVLPR